MNEISFDVSLNFLSKIIKHISLFDYRPYNKINCASKYFCLFFTTIFLSKSTLLKFVAVPEIVFLL